MNNVNENNQINEIKNIEAFDRFRLKYCELESKYESLVNRQINTYEKVDDLYKRCMSFFMSLRDKHYEYSQEYDTMIGKFSYFWVKYLFCLKFYKP